MRPPVRQTVVRKEATWLSDHRWEKWGVVSMSHSVSKVGVIMALLLALIMMSVAEARALPYYAAHCATTKLDRWDGGAPTWVYLRLCYWRTANGRVVLRTEAVLDGVTQGQWEDDGGASAIVLTIMGADGGTERNGYRFDEPRRYVYPTAPEFRRTGNYIVFNRASQYHDRPVRSSDRGRIVIRLEKIVPGYVLDEDRGGRKDDIYMRITYKNRGRYPLIVPGRTNTINDWF